MSTTALGPALDLDGPLPVERPFSLLKTPGVISPVENERWIGGVNVYGYPDGKAIPWEPCSTGTFRIKDESAVTGEKAAQPSPRFDSLALHFPITCSAHGMRDPMALSDRVEAALDAVLSEGVESIISKGVALSTNPFFGDTNMQVLAGGAAVSPAVGLAYLENAASTEAAREYLLHLTPAVVSALGFNYLRHGGEGEIVTANGTLVVSGAGYVGAHPLGPGGLQGPGTTSDWVFATGPVEVYIADGVRTEVSESLDRSDDTVVFRAEKYVLAEWDGAVQFGVLIDWSL